MKVQIGLVKYGSSYSYGENRAVLEKTFPDAHIFILNNQSEAAEKGEIQGSNSGHEFSGYYELLQLMDHSQPIVLFNDTLFKNHMTLGWLWLVKRCLKGLENHNHVIFGDLRFNGDDLPERPNPFLASWVFLLSGSVAVEEMHRTLANLLENPQPTWSLAYEVFLNEWLLSQKWYKGWHQKAVNSEILKLKKRNIYWEHCLSKALLENDGLTVYSLGHENALIYQTLRVLDRLKTGISRSLALIQRR